MSDESRVTSEEAKRGARQWFSGSRVDGTGCFPVLLLLLVGKGLVLRYLSSVSRGFVSLSLSSYVMELVEWHGFIGPGRRLGGSRPACTQANTAVWCRTTDISHAAQHLQRLVLALTTVSLVVSAFQYQRHLPGDTALPRLPCRLARVDPRRCPSSSSCAASALPRCLLFSARRYFVWTVERVLERVAVSMLSTQFIIEGSAVVCDVKGWSLENVSLP